MPTNLAQFPSTDAKLLAFSLNLKTRITATPTVYGLTAAQATAYGLVHDAFAAALAACDPGVRTKSSVVAKKTAIDSLKLNARLIISIINGQSSVTNAMKVQLGINVRATPQPIPAPYVAPGMDITGVSGRTVSVRLYDSAKPGKRGRPKGVQGASVFSYVGPTPPEEMSAWRFEGSTSNRDFDVTFPMSVVPGSVVWITAFWFNPRSMSGPATQPMSTHIQFGTVSKAA